jgi:hypothetical protein
MLPPPIGGIEMGPRKRVDTNQKEIVTALRNAGATVHLLSAVGQGCPDLLVGYGGVNFLLEVKDGAKPKSARKLTQSEQEWHDHWRGSVAIVEDVTQALVLIQCTAGVNAKSSDLE